MKIQLIAVGRLSGGPEQTLFETYRKRLGWSLDVREIDLRKKLSDAERQRAEGEAILDAVPAGCPLIALDEAGKTLDSRGLAQWIEDKSVHGSSRLALAIGGADGLSAQVKQRADLLLSFGRLTWPHMLVRTLVAEQIYRVEMILKGHPYHRD